MKNHYSSALSANGGSSTPNKNSGPQQQVLIQNTEFISSLNKYIPSLVLQQWITKADQQTLVLPELQQMETVVLFADISGFTMISEACAALGVRGNEELAFCINRYMEGMVKALGKYGGDIIKFVGDAMIVMWPRISGGSSSNGAQQSDDKVTIVRKAIQCALDIQNELNNKKIMSNVTNLSVKIGIGFGDCALLYVGGVFNRAEFFTVGEALTQALSSEENATAGGQIIVSEKAWSQVKGFFESIEILDEEHGKRFYRIVGMIQGIRTRADAVLLRNLIQADNFSRIQGKLRACVPAAIMPYLEIGYEQYGSETRRLTVMFASLGIDLSSAKTKEGMMKIQKIVTTVQQQVYRMEGSLNKLVMDDKGSTLICIWGLCPFSHEDDAARAILTAINIRRELLKIDKTWCNVGISTGEVFSGVVGTSGSRKEFSVLGDYVNLAARIMYYPKKYKQVGKINVDLQTKKEADNFINFTYKGHCEFKGKSISLPIFEPIDPAEISLQCIKKIVPHDTFLKIHSNPFIIDRNSDHKRKQAKQIGRDKLVKRVAEDLIDFLEDENPQSPYILAVSGELGSGKTLFARCIIAELKKNKNTDILKDHQLGLDQLLILTSSLNAESQMKFLNIWRPILQTMLYLVSKRRKGSVESTLQALMNFKNIKDDRYDVIFDIFGMQQIKPDGQIVPLPLPDDPFQFVKREVYAEEIVDGILDFVIDFIKIAIGDDESHNPQYSDDYQSQIEKSSQGAALLHPFGINMHGEPALLVLDTVFLMDEPSWRLLELIKEECSRIAIIMLVQTDTNNNAKIHPEARQFYNESFANNSSGIIIIDLPPFNVEDLNHLVSDVASKYQNTMGEEIHLMTFIEDPEHSIKNPEGCKQKEKDLRKQFMIQENYFSKVNESVIKLVLQRCEGNPLTSMNFLFNLIANDFLVQKGSMLEPNQKFIKCIQRSDWTIVPAAGISLKINCSLLDQFLKEMRSRPNKLDQESAVKGLLLLKCAAVVGDVFTSRVLQHISPLRHETHSSIMHLLKILESRDLIEILDDKDPKNAVCRFRKCFLRETIYQVMLYRAQKKGIHQLVVQYIQDNPNSIDQDPEVEAEKLLWHILLAEDLDSEDKIPLKSKQGLIVKKIANTLMKNPNAIVKRGLLTKEGNKPNRRVESRLMILKAKSLSWYHDQKEFEQGRKPLGVIYMHAIYHCVPAKTLKPTDDLNIGTCAWRKKDTDKEGKREFIFGAENQQQRDEWISCIEYLRTKAIYDSFVNKYCNITFPLRRQDDDRGEFEQKEDLLKLTSDFGFKFRSQAARTISDEYQSLQLQSQRVSSQKRSTYGKSISQNQLMNDISAINNSKELAGKIKKLLNVCLVSFVGHISQNANKNMIQRSETLKRLPEVLKGSNLLNQIHQDDVDESQSRLQSFVHGNNHSVSGILVDESPLGNFNKLKDKRRKSEIARKALVNEDSQVVRFIEDLRSAETSPPPIERKPDSNGGFSSDQMLGTNLNNQLIIGQRKSSVSNFTAKSQPQPNTQQSQFHTTNSDLSAPVPQNSENNIEDNKKVTKQEKTMKSRISVQIELMNQNQNTKQRTLTFNHDEENNGSPQQMFSLNVNPTERNTVMNQSRKHEKKMMEKIEEKEEYDRRGSGNSEQPNKKKEYESSSSSDEGKNQKDESGRNTGNFSYIDKREGSQSKQHSRQNSKIKEGQLNQSRDNPYQDRNQAQGNSGIRSKDISIDMKASKSGTPKLQSLASSMQSTQQPQFTQPANIQEIISQTIKEQVSQGFQQILQQVTQLTQQTMSNQQVSSPYSRKSNRPNNNNSYLQPMQYNQSSDRGVGVGGDQYNTIMSSQSISTLRDYQQDYREMLRIKQYTSSNGGGGASSSKKLKMEQPISKGKIVQRQGPPPIQQREDEDLIESPDLSDNEDRKINEKRVHQERHEKISPMRIQNDASPRMTNQAGYSQKQQKYSSVQERAPRMSSGAESVQSIPFNQQLYPKNQNNRFIYPQNSLQQSQQSLHPSQLGSMPGAQYGSPSQLYNQSQGQFFPGYGMPLNYQQMMDHKSQMMFPPQFHPSHMQSSQIENDSMLNFEDQPMDLRGMRQGDFSSMVNEKQMRKGAENQIYIDDQFPMLAIVLYDIQSIASQKMKKSKIASQGTELMQLYEGDQVEVLNIFEDTELAECRYENLSGIFTLNALKIFKHQGNEIGKQRYIFSLERFQSSPSREQKSAQIEEKKNKLKLNERKKMKAGSKNH